MNHEVGKKVYVQTKYTLIEGTVVKVTPSGKMDVKYSNMDRITRFSPDGEMIPQDKWAPVYLLEDQKAVENLAWEAKKKSLIEVASALRAVEVDRTVNFRWGKDGMQKEIDRLQALLSTAAQKLSEVK